MKYILIGVSFFVLGFLLVSAFLNKDKKSNEPPPLARDPRLPKNEKDQ